MQPPFTISTEKFITLKYLTCLVYSFFLKDLVYLFMRDRERERKREAETQAEEEAAPCREPDVGLDP